MKRVLFGFILLFCLFQTCNARDVYTSALWVEDLYSHAENKTIAVRINSRIGFICPNIATVARQRGFDRQSSEMNENLWLVQNETFYENCEIPTNTSSLAYHFVCNDATRLFFVDLLFLEFAAGQNDMTFEAGKYYYVLSTSDGTIGSLNNRKGGHCLTHNMRVKIYVCKKRSDPHPLCKNIDPKLNIIPPSDPSTPSPFMFGLINPGVPNVPAIITDTYSNTNTETVTTKATAAVTTKATETFTRKATEAVSTIHNDPPNEPVELIWEIRYNQTQTTTISKEEYYPVVALCNEPNAKISLLNNKGRIVDSWLCQKVDERMTILKPEYRNDDVYLFVASPEYSPGRIWKSSLFVNVHSIKHRYISNVNSLYSPPALALLISLYLFIANAL